MTFAQTRTCSLLLVYITALSACRRPVVSPPPPPAATISQYPAIARVTARPIVWRYRVNSGEQATTRPFELRSLDAAVFDDGTVIWSNSSTKDGRPYRTAHLAPDALKTLHAVLAADASTSRLNDLHYSFGPDSTYHVIAYDLGPQRQVEFASWHELFEANPGLAVTDRGVEVLAGRNKSAVVSAASPAYQKFRSRWSALTAALRQAVPKAGEEVDPAQLTWK